MNLLKIHSLPIFMITVSLLFALIGNTADAWLQYNRSALMEGEWWRLISGHFLHRGWMHLLLNQAALLFIWQFSRDFLSNATWWGAMLFCALGISLSLFVLMPELQWYVGLSGILHGLFAVGAVAGIARGSREFIALLILMGAKVVWEQANGALSAGMVVDGEIIVNAHLYGMVSGLVYAFLLLGYRVRKSGPDSRNI